MEKMIEIAHFQQVEEAELLVGLLKSEGIDSYVRNEVSSRVLPNIIVARVELLESDVPRALEIMNDCGFAQFAEEDNAETAGEPSGLARYIPVLRHFSFEKQLVILLVLTGGFLAILVYLVSYLSSKTI
ncbi:MAG: DUF2007 domain-containing protein [Tannerella sp.]|nr:DUF2007 domain-containing protein [Tannerella sp.]